MRVYCNLHVRLQLWGTNIGSAAAGPVGRVLAPLLQVPSGTTNFHYGSYYVVPISN